MPEKMLTAAEFVSELSETTGFPKGEIRFVMTELEDLVINELKKGKKVKIGQLVQLQPRIRPARKKRMGRNPQTGEAVQIAAKPASSVVKARVLKKAKEAVPSVQKLRKMGA